jgi:hypothetical protein
LLENPIDQAQGMTGTHIEKVNVLGVGISVLDQDCA